MSSTRKRTEESPKDAKKLKKNLSDSESESDLSSDDDVDDVDDEIEKICVCTHEFFFKFLNIPAQFSQYVFLRLIFLDLNWLQRISMGFNYF